MTIRLLFSVIAVMFVGLLSGCKEPASTNGIRIYPLSKFSEVDLHTADTAVKVKLDSWIKDGYKPYYKEFFSQNNIDKALVLLSKSDGVSLAPASEIVGMVMKYSDDKSKWQMEIASDSIIRAGTNHGITITPITKLVMVGKDKYAIVFSSRGGGQGYYMNNMSLVAITGKGFETCLQNINTGGDNSGTGSSKWSYILSFDAIPSSKEYYDLALNLSGTGNYKVEYVDSMDKYIASKLKNGKAVLAYVNGKYI